VLCLLSPATEQQVAERCDVIYGDVIDKAARKNVSICGRAEQDGGLSRVYVSQSNLLHIVFTPAASPQQQQQRNFIIHVEGNVTVDRLQESCSRFSRVFIKNNHGGKLRYISNGLIRFLRFIVVRLKKIFLFIYFTVEC